MWQVAIAIKLWQLSWTVKNRACRGVTCHLPAIWHVHANGSRIRCNSPQDVPSSLPSGGPGLGTTSALWSFARENESQHVAWIIRGARYLWCLSRQKAWPGAAACMLQMLVLQFNNDVLLNRKHCTNRHLQVFSSSLSLLDCTWQGHPGWPESRHQCQQQVQGLGYQCPCRCSCWQRFGSKN